ncbi:MAG: hypothetical protein R2771_05685 [Saprospiraceae bacterium]
MTNTDIAYSPNTIASAGIYLDILKLIKKENKNSLNFNFNTKYVGKQYLDNTQNDVASLDAFTYSDLGKLFLS